MLKIKSKLTTTKKAVHHETIIFHSEFSVDLVLLAVLPVLCTRLLHSKMEMAVCHIPHIRLQCYKSKRKSTLQCFPLSFTASWPCGIGKAIGEVLLLLFFFLFGLGC